MVGATNEIVACWNPAEPTTLVGTPGATGVMLKVCVTDVAAAKLALPAWLAVMEHMPCVTMVIFSPLTVQTGRVFDSKDTVRPDDAVAPDANAVGLKGSVPPPGCANVMVCVADAITKVTTWVLSGLIPFVALTEKLYVPAAVGVPVKAPPEDRVKPGGNVPVETEKVGAGAPVAVKLWLYAVLTTPALGAALVIFGAALRFRVKVVAGNAEKVGLVAQGELPSTKMKFEAGAVSTLIT